MMAKTSTKARKVSTSQEGTSRIINIIKGNVYAYMLTLVFLIAGALLLTYTDMSESKLNWLIFIGVILSSMIVGCDTAKQEKSDGWKWGLIGGISYAVIYMIVSMISDRSLRVDKEGVIILILCLVGGILGGMIGINKKK